jgi:hypothetical protein
VGGEDERRLLLSCADGRPESALGLGVQSPVWNNLDHQVSIKRATKIASERAGRTCWARPGE